MKKPQSVEKIEKACEMEQFIQKWAENKHECIAFLNRKPELRFNSHDCKIISIICIVWRSVWILPSHSNNGKDWILVGSWQYQKL